MRGAGVWGGWAGGRGNGGQEGVDHGGEEGDGLGRDLDVRGPPVHHRPVEPPGHGGGARGEQGGNRGSGHSSDGGVDEGICYFFVNRIIRVIPYSRRAPGVPVGRLEAPGPDELRHR